jgi:hypothetical protein
MQTYRDSNALMEYVIQYMDTLMEYTRHANTLHHRSYDGSEHEGSKDSISGLRAIDGMHGMLRTCGSLMLLITSIIWSDIHTVVQAE